MNIVIIKAGGVGSRMSAGIPKQFICVHEKPIIIYTIEAFERHPEIDEIIVVCVDGWHDRLRTYLREWGIRKVTRIVSGGDTSLKSIRCGVEAVDSDHHREDDLILIHDANRPLISSDIITDVIEQGRLYGTAVAAIQSTDEIMETQDAASLEANRFLNRKTIFRIQTPDAYRLCDIKKLLSEATEEEYNHIGATNTLWIAHGGNMRLARGSEVNIRLTRQEDISLFSALLDLRDRLQ